MMSIIVFNASLSQFSPVRTTSKYAESIREEKRTERQPRWQRIILLCILGYEAAGCLLGGSLLIAAPDGAYLDMAVSIMHGTFQDFLVPGLVLFALGVLNLLAFITILQKMRSDWFMAGLALGGLFAWFVVEIIILKELHWLHLMWGYPVLLGWVVTIPLIIMRNNTASLLKALLTCGALSSIWYACINVFVPLQYEGYSTISVTVSELSAIGAPTRILWILLVIFYPLLLLFFGWGVVKSAYGNRYLRITGILIIAYSILNFYWPPMHRREVIAAGGGTLTDNLHLVWAMVTLLFNLLIMGFGAAASSKGFRLYTLLTWGLFIVFGVLTFRESPGIETNSPTPYIGLWERINIGAFLLWIGAFAIRLIPKESSSGSTKFNKVKMATQPTLQN